MLKISVVAAVAALGLALPAYAADTGASASEAAPKAKEKMVCERIEEVGSRSVKKICRPESEWRAERERAKHEVAERDRDDR